jgi:PTH1 family peptidyl-tRNA hydrolase
MGILSLLPFFQQNRGDKNMIVIAGLGNPGKEYDKTKHNVGFWVIDQLAKEYNIDVTKFKHKALIGDGVIAGKKVLLVKPQTYMNLSGESIREILKFYKIPIEQFYVIYDDTSLPLSSVRIREKGSAGGHNGIKNIIAHLNTDAFIRIKVGIGEKPNGWDLADYVLAKFSKDDEPLILSGVEKASHAIEILLTKGIVEAMNQTNQKLKKENKKSKPSNTNEVIS